MEVRHIPSQVWVDSESMSKGNCSEVDWIDVGEETERRETDRGEADWGESDRQRWIDFASVSTKEEKHTE